jgi:hypothetical protein
MGERESVKISDGIVAATANVAASHRDQRFLLKCRLHRAIDLVVGRNGNIADVNQAMPMSRRLNTM